MTLVIGTAGHIDHGKTSLLRALTGIDADRLPEERRRGMTIDVGYAHLRLPDGRQLDFVDVPGHDRLVGNMLVGAGEVDAALLVVAADDGPRAQTLEHLGLLDGLGIGAGLAVVTKADVVDEARLADVRIAVSSLLARTSLRGSPVLTASSVTAAGIDALRDALSILAARLEPGAGHASPPRLGVDRAFTVRGRGAVVTGTLRGGVVARGDVLRAVPGDRPVRVREVQVHGLAVPSAGLGRAAFNLAGVDVGDLARGLVLTSDPGMVATDRLLVMLAAPSPLGDPASGVPPGPWPPGDGTRARLHLGTAEAGATIGGVRGDGAIEAGDRAIAVIRLDRPVAAVPGDRFVLRRPSPGRLVAAGVVLDPRPPTGVSRRRATPERVAALADAVRNGDRDRAAGATLALHGSRPSAPGGAPDLADDVRAALHAEARRAIAADHAAHPGEAGMPVAMVRGTLVAGVRRLVTIDPSAAMVAVDRVLDDLARASEIARDGDRVRLRSHAPSGPDPSLLEAMDRLEAALASAAPPPLSEAARAVRCPPHGVRALERSGRIVVLEPDLAWAATTWRDLARQALALANRAPLTPAAYRDATGTSRRYVLAILEDLDRRGILRRTESGHLPGPRAGALAQGPSPT